MTKKFMFFGLFLALVLAQTDSLVFAAKSTPVPPVKKPVISKSFWQRHQTAIITGAVTALLAGGAVAGIVLNPELVKSFTDAIKDKMSSAREFVGSMAPVVATYAAVKTSLHQSFKIFGEDENSDDSEEKTEKEIIQADKEAKDKASNVVQVIKDTANNVVATDSSISKSEVAVVGGIIAAEAAKEIAKVAKEEAKESEIAP